MKRTVDKKTWAQIAAEVRNLEGERPYWKVVRKAFLDMGTSRGKPKKDKYENCGRAAILTPTLIKWLVKTMRERRVKDDCTSTDLQLALAREKGVTVDVSTIRKALNGEGYYYLPRAKKPKYDKDARANRVKFSGPFSRCTADGLKDKCNICLDGVVFIRPPSKPVDRENFIHSDTPRIWRRHDEHDLPELSGYDKYAKQVPASTA